MVEQVEPVGSGFKAIQDENGIRFEKVVHTNTEPVGVAYVEPEKAKTRRELELEEGRKRVAAAAKEIANRPPRIISDAEKQAQGTNVPVFRPNNVYADRVISHNGRPVSQTTGALMRRVGGGQVPPV